MTRLGCVVVGFLDIIMFIKCLKKRIELLGVFFGNLDGRIRYVAINALSERPLRRTRGGKGAAVFAEKYLNFLPSPVGAISERGYKYSNSTRTICGLMVKSDAIFSQITTKVPV